jgi:hypothetical protein
MLETLKTRIHYFHFNDDNPGDTAAWHALCNQLAPTHTHPMEAFEGTPGWDAKHIRPLDGQEIELETKHLFDNQWNTAPTATSANGLRVFDWHKIVHPHNRKLHTGHWLEITPEMREIRRNTIACGYCGAQEPAAKGYVFCPHCLDSAYLKESDLPLLRMRSIDTPFTESRPPLSEPERAHLLPLYRAAQISGNTTRGHARIAKQRADIAAELEKTTHNARQKHDGLLWLLDRGVQIDNVIYYDHTGKFSFGWRTPIAESVWTELAPLIADFPFEYEVKHAAKAA